MARRTPTADATRAVAYLRVSTDEQHLGPEAQRAAIQRWADAHGVTVVAWHEDHGVSGGAALERRPALLAALDELGDGDGAGVLVVAKRDRLARDVVVAAMVERLAERSGARIVSADGAGNADGPEGMLMRGIVDLFAQYERALIRARTTAALAVKKARSERVGTVPFGWRLAADGVALVPDPTEAATVSRVRELRAAGVSIRGIVAELASEGHEARTGRPVSKGTVENILRRESEAA